jgi:hypothetical protein
VQLEPRMPLQPAPDFLVLVGAVVVQDQMEFLAAVILGMENLRNS